MVLSSLREFAARFTRLIQSSARWRIYTVSQKNCANLFFCQILTDCENFWHKYSKENKLFYGVLIFHLT